LDENSTGGVHRGKNSAAAIIQACDLIIWDEVPMQHKHVLACVDRELRDLCDNDKPFGGKVVVFSGDFRQVCLL